MSGEGVPLRRASLYRNINKVLWSHSTKKSQTFGLYVKQYILLETKTTPCSEHTMPMVKDFGKSEILGCLLGKISNVKENLLLIKNSRSTFYFNKKIK